MEINLSGKTQIFGILGCPIAHSLSPLMQNAAFAAAGINAVYVPFLVHKSELSMAVAGLRALNVRGCNVTIPHKQNIVAYLDMLSPEAQAIGAVNTVACTGNKLVGYNTDASGFLGSLQHDLGFSPGGHKVMVLGAGGAARACVYALCRAGTKELAVANRNRERAEALCEELSLVYPKTSLYASSLSSNTFDELCSTADLIVNTTSIGLHTGADVCDPLPWENINSKTLFYDVVYRPGSTSMVKRAHANRMHAVDGLGMLIAQGEEAFRIWTGVDPGDSMKRAVKAAV